MFRRLLAAIAVLIAPSTILDADDPGDVRTALDRYKAALASVHSGDCFASGTRATTARQGERKNERADRFTIARVGDRILVRRFAPEAEKASPDEYWESIAVLDPPNSFSVSKNGKAQPYFGEVSAIDQATRASFGYEVNTVLESPYALLGTPILRILNAPKTMISAVSRETTPEGERLKIAFTGEAGMPASRKLRGWWTVDPAAGWVLVDYELRSVEPDRPSASGARLTAAAFRGGVRYAKAAAEGPRPSQIKEEQEARYADGTEFSYINTIEIDDFIYETYPAREFALEHYGLGDLMSPPGEGGPRYLVPLVSIAVVAAVASYFLLRLSRRSRTRGRDGT